METMDGFDMNRWEVGMITEEKWRKELEEGEICKNDVRIRRPKVVWLVKHQTCIKGPGNRDSFRELSFSFIF